MACSDYNTYWEFMANWQFFDAVYCLYGEQVGFFLFPLLAYGALATALYIFAGSLIMPLVLTIILGGVVVAQLPPGPVRLVGIVVLFAVALGGYLLVQRLET
jgi:hypothetical protein